MHKKRTSLLVVFFLIFSANALAENNPDYFDSSERTPIFDASHCFTDNELDLFADIITKEKVCQQNLILYKNFAAKNFIPPSTPWYQEPGFVVGGISVSFALGGLVYYILSSKK